MIFGAWTNGEYVKIEIESDKLYIKEKMIYLENDVVSVFFSKTKWFLLYNYKKSGKVFPNNIFTYDYSGNFLYKVGDIINAKNLCFTGISPYYNEDTQDEYIVCGTFDCVNYIFDAANGSFLCRKQSK